MISVDQLVANASRFGHGAQTVALAGALLGLDVNALCCWCLDKHDPQQQLRVARLQTKRSECLGCPYVGPDVLVVY